MKNRNLVIALLLLSLSVLCGCPASYHARSGDVKGAVLVNPEILQEGTGDQALYRYVNPAFDIKKYSSIIVEPLLIAKDGETSASEQENYQKLANNGYVYLVTEMEKQIKVVKEPSKGAMKLQVAIRDADSSKPVRMLTSSVTPIGAGISVLKFAAMGKPSGVGEITAEFKLTDAATGELLAAALDRRVGGKNITSLWDTWHNADDSLQQWAKHLGFLLCNQLQAKDCKKP